MHGVGEVGGGGREGAGIKFHFGCNRKFNNQ